MRPCGRGINVQGTPAQEPYVALDEEIGAALGLDSGNFYIEIVARPKPPKSYKPKTVKCGVTKTCRGCGGKMNTVHDVMGDSWSCRTCGLSEEIGIPKCEDDGCEMKRGGPALDTHREYWRCPECGWSFDIIDEE
jgi:hypothetical protein